MIFRQFYLNCLAHASYLIADGGEAAVVDPQRDVEQYIAEAQRAGATIKYVIETHLHADFVSGHRELAARTGATIVFGARAEAEMAHRAVRDGDVLRVGNVELRALETPGHTPESVSWVIAENGRPSRVLTGDTLFIGDVGRPDLAGGRGFTAEEMAAMLYDSLHDKLLALPDEVEVWPAHGAGSACGRNISRESSSTMGMQRKMNYALQPMAREEFVNMMTNGLAAPPRYFPRDAEINRRGAAPLADLNVGRLTSAAVREAMQADAVVLDVRDAAVFCASHVDGSVNIGLDGQFASWVGTLLSMETPIVLVASDERQAEEAVMRLARVGFENAIGYVTNFDDLPTRTIVQMSVNDLAATPRPVLDVRRPGEFASGRIPGAQNVPLDELPERLSEVPRGTALAVVCAGGYRSSMACSLLARAGFANVVNVTGGTSAWVREGLATEKEPPR
jgi:glyoxylase-like metal-dependent hydrolase (beta-lactamase superfamily II)/rhodanese-related sulfurtransferase